MPKYIDVGVEVTVRVKVSDLFDLHAREGEELISFTTKLVTRSLESSFEFDANRKVTGVEFISADTEEI